jgi:hypothetical protein
MFDIQYETENIFNLPNITEAYEKIIASEAYQVDANLRIKVSNLSGSRSEDYSL